MKNTKSRILILAISATITLSLIAGCTNYTNAVLSGDQSCDVQSEIASEAVFPTPTAVNSEAGNLNTDTTAAAISEDSIPGLSYGNNVPDSDFFISGTFTEDSLKPFHYVPDENTKDKFINQFRKLNAQIDESKEFFGFTVFPMWYSIVCDGVLWELWSDGILIRNEESESGTVRMRADAPELTDSIQSLLSEKLGIVPFEPHMIKNIVSAKLELIMDDQHYEQTVVDLEVLAAIEDLLSSASQADTGCPFNEAYLTLKLAGGNELFLAMSTDDCTTYYVNGRSFYYTPKNIHDAEDWNNNQLLYKYFDEIPIINAHQ